MTQRQIYRSAKGKEIDMFKLMKQNELVPAVGTANVNARGDKLGPDGQIIKTREEILSEKLVSVSAPVIEEAPVPQPVVQPVAQKAPVQPTKKDISNQDPEGNE